MRKSAMLLAILAACGSKPPPKVVEPPTRPLGPEEIGPVPPEQRHVDAETYTVDVDAPPFASVKEKVQAKVIVKAKTGMAISATDEWKMITKAANDMDVTSPILTRATALVLPDTITYVVEVVPLRAGVRHVTFKLDGSVCDEQFCDVVGDQVSWNLEVR